MPAEAVTRSVQERHESRLLYLIRRDKPNTQAIDQDVQRDSDTRGTENRFDDVSR
jgi:hypothetical protein